MGSLSAYVLLIEDNLIAQKMTKHILETLGCKVNVTDNGSDAIAFIQQYRYDMILLDIGLPDMSGYELTRYIRTQNKAQAKIPIIGITAHLTEKEKNECTISGMNECILKPATIDNIRRIVIKYLQQG